jgi:diacylglycerol kinase family enzyme
MNQELADARSGGGSGRTVPGPRERKCDGPFATTGNYGSWVGIIANRGSGIGATHQLVRKLNRDLGRLGLPTEVAWTPTERQALVALANGGSRCRCLVAVGGDGTVSALINERPRVPITVLPTGTENLAAQQFGLRRNPAALARTIAAGHVMRTDLGTAAGKRFLLMTGFGFDGDVVTRHHLSRTSRSGLARPTHRAAYVEPILRASLLYRFPPIRLHIADAGAEETLTGTTVFVFNMPRYALGLPFAPQARHDDGLLDLVVFRDPGPFQALYYLWRVFCGTHLEHPGVMHRRVRRLRVTSNHAVPVQLDGDPAGFLRPNDHSKSEEAPAGSEAEHDWTIEVLPGALDVLVPVSHALSAQTVPLARMNGAR